MPAKEVLISLKNVGFTYNRGLPTECAALFDISLDIVRGEIISLIGHTGSGKSTLIQLLNSQRMPDCGEIRWHMDGVCDEKGLPVRRRVCAAVGLVFQYPEDQVFEETVYEDIAFGPRQLGKTPEETEKIVFRTAELMGLDKQILYKTPFELSGGTLRKVAIAGVLAMEPRVLVLDEPMAGLDPKSCDGFASLLLGLRECLGLSIVMVSHNLEYSAALSDKIYYMNGDRIVLSGTAREVFSDRAKLDEHAIGVIPAASVAAELAASGMKIEKTPLTAEELAGEILNNYGK